MALIRTRGLFRWAPWIGLAGLVTLTLPIGEAEAGQDPTAIQGLQALFVVNLAPRKMAGEVSEGMLFDLGYEDGIVPCLAVPEREVPDGTRAG